MRTMTVHQNNQPIYDIVFSADYGDLPKALAALSLKGRKVCIVSETNVAPHYLESVTALFKKEAAFVTSFVFPAGEAYKNLNTVQDLYEKLILSKFERKDILVALGGGVVGDLTGYTAATYLRGIDFIQLPTSLLSQVDSSIGGKTGVDFHAYKNMIGAFHQPKLVYINLSALKSLKENEYLSGMGEIIKHGLIQDQSYYEQIKSHVSGILARDPAYLEPIIYKSCDIKRQIVEKDPKEMGERAFLNFGHTIGHAVEKLMDFSMLHGECVSIGAAGAAYISMKRQMISREDYADILNTFKAFHLPVSFSGLHAEAILKTTKLDKKMDAGHVKFILLDSIGRAVIDRTVTDEEILEAIEAVRED